MSLMTNYAPAYGDLDDTGMTKVGQFSAQFLSAKSTGNEEAMKAMLKQAVAGIAQGGDEALDRMFGTLHYVERYGEPEDKEAVAKLLPMINDAIGEMQKEAEIPSWAVGMGAASLALQAAPIIDYAIRRSQRSGRIQESMKQILRENPDLRTDPNTARYFQAIVDFAPDVAANPLVAGNVLVQLHRLGPTAVTPKTIAELLDIQGAVNKAPRLSDSLSRVDLGTATKAWGSKPQDSKKS